MRRLLLAHVALVTLVALPACDPIGPGATGTLTVSGSSELSTFTSLEIRFFPDVDHQLDLAGPPSLSSHPGESVLQFSSMCFDASDASCATTSRVL